MEVATVYKLQSIATVLCTSTMWESRMELFPQEFTLGPCQFPVPLSIGEIITTHHPNAQ